MSEPVAIAIVTPEERAQREREGQGLVVAANELVIDSGDTFTKAAKWLQETVLPLKRRISETFRPRIQQAHQLHKGLVEDEKRFLAPVEGAERVVRGKIAAYEQEQAQRRREAEAAARREQERLEAEERARVEAEQRRLAAEAEEQRLAAAVEAEQRGDRESAERLIAAPVEVPAVAPRPVFAPPAAVVAPPKVEGLSFRDEWKAEVIDLIALVTAVAAGRQPLTLLQPNTVALNQMARALRGALNVPGVRAVSTRGASIKA